MINYQSANPSKEFLMVDKSIDENLSETAYYLLIKFMKLAPNERNDNTYLMKKTGFGKRKFDKAKKELVNKGYLDTKQLFDNKYALYIGKSSVSLYKRRNKQSANNRHEQNYLRKVAESHKKAPSKVNEE
jgi:hypothetical protein